MEFKREVVYELKLNEDEFNIIKAIIEEWVEKNKNSGSKIYYKMLQLLKEIDYKLSKHSFALSPITEKTHNNFIPYLKQNF